MSVSAPAAMAGQPARCGALGSPSVSVNQVRTIGWKGARCDASAMSNGNQAASGAVYRSIGASNHTAAITTMIPATSSRAPYRIIRDNGTYPEPYTIALQGVETGSMKPRLAAKVAPSAGSSGSTPAARAIDMTTGTTMLAAAVLEVVSESTTATSTADTSIPRLPWMGRRLVSPR